ncbi:MAG: glycosyltransferase 87 family protein [Gemmataceae bacterium]
MNLRRLVTVVGVAVAGMLLAGQVRQLLADPTIWPPDDFVEYWAAAKLTLNGENPYDGAKLLPLQQAAGRDTNEPIMMWNPPWSLAVVLPLGWFPAREAQLLWLLANLAAIAFCGDRLWLMFGGGRESRWIGWAAALGFLPTLFALQSGQIGPLLLLGAVLFLECERRGWPMLAGASTLLLAVKPHMAYLVWVAILLKPASRSKGDTGYPAILMILGGLIAGVFATMIAVAFDPPVLAQYMDAMANRPPSQWVSPTFGTVLRMAFGEDLFKLQFVPVLVGLAWFAWHWKQQAATWNWTEQLPLLLLVSFVTAPYGAWPFDMVLLLPAVVRLVVLRKPAILASLLAVNLACLAMNLLETGSFAFIWVSPTILAIYVLGTRPAAEPLASRNAVAA